MVLNTSRRSSLVALGLERVARDMTLDSYLTAKYSDAPEDLANWPHFCAILAPTVLQRLWPVLSEAGSPMPSSAASASSPISSPLPMLKICELLRSDSTCTGSRSTEEPLDPCLWPLARGLGEISS